MSAALFGTTDAHADLVVSMLVYVPGKWTISDLVRGPKESDDRYRGGCGLTASEVRRALGWLYGQGRARIVEVKDGAEVWAATTEEERVKL